MSPREHWKEALARAELAALDHVAATMRLTSPTSSVLEVGRTERVLLFACRDVTRAVEALAQEDQPSGWAA